MLIRMTATEYDTMTPEARQALQPYVVSTGQAPLLFSAADVLLELHPLDFEVVCRHVATRSG